MTSSYSIRALVGFIAIILIVKRPSSLQFNLRRSDWELSEAAICRNGKAMVGRTKHDVSSSVMTSGILAGSSELG